MMNPSTACAVPLPLGKGGRAPTVTGREFVQTMLVRQTFFTGRRNDTRGRWSVVQISNLGNNTHAIAVKISDFGNGEPFPTVVCGV